MTARLIEERSAGTKPAVWDASYPRQRGTLLARYGTPPIRGLQVDPGESLEETARREVFEETGIDQFVLGPELYAREAEFLLRGERLLAIEHYFAGSVVAADTTLEHLDALEQGVLVEHRWWTVHELADAARGTTIFPTNILDLVQRTLDVQ